MAGGTINVRAFIEGVEIPVIECVVTESLGGAASASLTVPHHRLGRSILERSLVHLFYYDTDDFDFLRQEAMRGESTFIADGAGFDRYPISDERRLKLLFWGEVAGYGRVISTHANSLTYSLLGFSNYFDTIKQFQALRGAGSVSDVERRFSGIEEAFTTGRSGRYGTANSILSILREGGDNFQDSIKELMTEFIVRTNEFYKSRTTILRLKDMVRAIENDETVEALFDLSVFRRYLRQVISGGGLQVTIRSILQTLAQFLFHDIVEHASPSYFPLVTAGVRTSLANDQFDPDAPVVQREDQVDQMTGIVFKPELWWAAPPACNILFPQHYSALQEQVTPLIEPTRTVLKIQPGVSGHRNTITDNFFAPDTESLNSLAESVPLSSQHVFLLPHERYRGVNTNFVFINEIARLVRNDSYRDYMKSYAQFMHWKSTYSTRRISVTSARHLPNVLVGYTAVAIDPTVRSEVVFDFATRAERLRLARLLASLRSCLRRLRARLAAILNKIERANSILYYFEWLHWVDADEACLNTRDLTPSTAMSDPDAAMSEDPGALSFGTWSIQNADGRLHIGNVPSDHDMPEPDVGLMEEILPGSPLIPNDQRNVVLNPRDPPFLGRLLADTNTVNSQVVIWRAEASSLRARIARVQTAIDEIMRYLRSFGYTESPVEHVIFYVESKTTTLRNGAQGGGSTSISGSYARMHDEDIDLDGNRGDSFDNIIKHGAGGFFSDIYDAESIGSDFYSPLYGVGSLIDVGARMQSMLAESGNIEQEVDASVQRSPDEIRWQAIVEELCQRDLDATTGTEGFDVEMALDALSDVYRMLVTTGNDMDRFVSSIVARPIATMVDIFGSEILSEESNQSEYGNYSGSGRQAGVGFHEFAFIQGASGAETFDTTGLESGESDQLDVATARRNRVLAYANAIKVHAGQRQ